MKAKLVFHIGGNMFYNTHFRFTIYHRFCSFITICIMYRPLSVLTRHTPPQSIQLQGTEVAHLSANERTDKGRLA